MSNTTSSSAQSGFSHLFDDAQTFTIGLSAPLVAPTERDTVFDGGHRIVLDGQDRTQILTSARPNFRVNDRYVAVQRLKMIRGRDVGTGFKPRDGERTCAWGYKDGGGGAISTRDVNVRVWGVTFENNRGPEIGPDVAGGAIYVVGSKSLTVVNSIFCGNSASNGGAIRCAARREPYLQHRVREQPGHRHPSQLRMHYNSHRPHKGLNGRTPLAVF